MGEVFLARQLSLDRDVALKILPAHYASQRDDVERFLQEMRLLARLDHPNIVTAYEAGEDTGIIYLAMAYVKGESLSARLRREQRLAAPEALRLTHLLAEALAYAWNEHLLLHRDVKPGNVLIDSHGNPKLLDFGLAKGLGTDAAMTMSPMMMGSPNYMSPEQAAGNIALDFRTDIYGLGATLYHLLTGKAPFDASSVMDTLRKSVTEKLPDPREVNGSVTGGCVALLSRMLALVPDGRHASWESLIEDITRVSKGLPPHLPELPAKASALAHRTHAHGAVLHGPVLHVPRNIAASAPAAPASVAPQRKGISAGAWAAVGVALFVGITLLSLWLAMRSSGHETLQQFPVAVRVSPPKRLTPIAPRLAQSPSIGTPAAPAVGTVRSPLPPAEATSSDTRRQNLPEPAPPTKQEAAPLHPPKAPESARGTLAKPGDGDTRVSPREALARHGEALADALLERNRDRLQTCLDAGAADPALVPVPEQWRSLVACAEQAAAIPETLLASFKHDIGREVTVDLATGTRQLLIAGIRGDTVEARQIIREGSRVKAEIARDFRLDELSPRGKLARLGAGEDAVTRLRCGLLAWECQVPDAARRGFEQAACLLGTSLVSRLDARLRERADAADAQTRAAAENAASLNFEQLLKLACPSFAGGNDDAIHNAVQTIRKTRYTEKIAAEITRRTADFLARHGATACARDQAAALATLASVRPNVPLAVDPATLSAAEAALRKANPRVDIDWYCSVLDTGLQLDLSRSRGAITDLRALAGLPIRSLQLGNNEVDSLEPLKGMPLRSLSLGACKVSELAHLKDMPLETLMMDAPGIFTLRPIQGLPLRKLHLKSSNAITSLAPLAGLSLTNFSFGYSRITDITPLKGMPLVELELLFLRDLKDITPLRGMPLTRLTLRDCFVQDISALADMPIERLFLVNTRVSDLTPLKNLPLTHLNLDGTRVIDLSALQGLPLVNLSLQNTRVTDLKPLQTAPLTWIDLRKSAIRDVSPLAGKPIAITMPDGSTLRGVP